MLGKLLKYDLKYMIKSIGIFYILTIFFAIITRIFFLLKQTLLIEILGQISMGCMFSMMASTLINTIMRSWVRFTSSVYLDESYLTHTLPVSKNSIYQSKFLLTLIYQLIGFIIIVIGLFIAFYTKNRWDLLVNFIKDASGVFNMPIVPFVIGLIIVLYLEIFNIIQSGFLGIILGHKKNNNKIGYSVLFGFISYLISQIFVVISLFIIGLFNKDIMNLFTSTTLRSVDIIKTLVILAIILYTIINIIVNLICVKKINDGVNVE